MNRESTEINNPQVRIMTDAEIRSNAEEYAKRHYDIPFEENSSMNVIVSEESYIDGAHSRNPEIEWLRAQLEYEKEMTKFCIDDLNQEIEELKSELAKVKKEKKLLSSSYKILEYRLNELDPEWMHK